MAIKVIVPQKGLSDETCLIQEWKKKEGDRVEKGEIICEIETNKAAFEIESPVSGVILKILHQEGEEVPVMDTIAIIGEPEEEYKHPLDGKEAKKKEPVESKTGSKTIDKVKLESKGNTEKSVQIMISPRARKLALKKNIDISVIKGSGPRGRIIERDIKETISKKITAEQEGKRPDVYQEIPVKGIRKIIADRMFQSLQKTAQLTLHSSFQAKNLLNYRSKLKESYEKVSNRDININHLIMFGIIKALKEYPEMNSHYHHDKIVQFSEIHLGFAVDTEEGLKVPVIHQTEQYSLEQFAQKVQNLTQQCLDRSIQPDDLAGGTFTVTNLGNLGIEYFTPILNSPQTGIMGIGCQQIKPIIYAHSIEFIPVIGLSLTFDHRVIDGAPAARFLKLVINILEELTMLPH